MSQEAHSPPPAETVTDRTKALYGIIISGFLTVLAITDPVLALCSAAIAAGIVVLDLLSPSFRRKRKAERRSHLQNVSISAG